MSKVHEVTWPLDTLLSKSRASMPASKRAGFEAKVRFEVGKVADRYRIGSGEKRNDEWRKPRQPDEPKTGLLELQANEGHEFAGPLGVLVREMLANVPPANRERFLAEVLHSCHELTAKLSKVAKEYGDGGWEKMKDEWPRVCQEYEAQRRRFELQATDIPADTLWGTVMWMTEQGTTEDLPLLNEKKKKLASCPEEAQLIEEAMRRIVERASAPPEGGPPPLNGPSRPLSPEAEGTVNCYTLMFLGDALLPDTDNAVPHESGDLFVRVFHKGERSLEGVFDVSMDGQHVEWYDLNDATREADGWRVTVFHRGTRQPCGTLRLSRDAKDVDWQPETPEGGPGSSRVPVT